MIRGQFSHSFPWQNSARMVQPAMTRLVITVRPSNRRVSQCSASTSEAVGRRVGSLYSSISLLRHSSASATTSASAIAMVCAMRSLRVFSTSSRACLARSCASSASFFLAAASSSSCLIMSASSSARLSSIIRRCSISSTRRICSSFKTSSSSWAFAARRLLCWSINKSRCMTSVVRTEPTVYSSSIATIRFVSSIKIVSSSRRLCKVARYSCSNCSCCSRLNMMSRTVGVWDRTDCSTSSLPSTSSIISGMSSVSVST
mmetsp:Transcript_30082/g.72207  ORF Transcript_30082/g.72207 Transcript_30082/m.72207 type:complete len:259 (+) Transcript_30082:1385-2161(+)